MAVCEAGRKAADGGRTLPNAPLPTHRRRIKWKRLTSPSKSIGCDTAGRLVNGQQDWIGTGLPGVDSRQRPWLLRTDKRGEGREEDEKIEGRRGRRRGGGLQGGRESSPDGGKERARMREERASLRRPPRRSLPALPLARHVDRRRCRAYYIIS